jgi:hypothetical protein
MAELLARWPPAVGDHIARNAWPARIARDGTVHVNTADSIWAFELGHRAREIAERLGVQKLRFAPGPLPSPEQEQVLREAVVPGPAETAQAARIAASIEDENLRESVEKAVGFSLARAAANRRV